MATVTTNTLLSALSYAAGEAITITSGATLTVDVTPAINPGTITCVTWGRLLVQPASPGTPLVLTLDTNTNDIIINNAGVFEARGSMITVGTGTGAAQTFDFTAGGLATIPYPAYVEVETSAGSGEYEPWIVIPEDPSDTSPMLLTDWPDGSWPASRVLAWHSTDRTLRCGDDVNGRAIPTGAGVRVPDIYLNCAVGSATDTGRSTYDLSPGGRLDWECVGVCPAIYMGTATGSGKIRMFRVGLTCRFSGGATNGTVTLEHVSFNPSPNPGTTTGALATLSTFRGALTLYRITACTQVLAGSNVACLSIVQAFQVEQIEELLVVGKRNNANARPLYLSSLVDVTIRGASVVGGRMNGVNLTRCRFESLSVADELLVNSTALATNAIVLTNCSDITFNGVDNAAPTACRNALVSCDAQCRDVVFFDIFMDGYTNLGGLVTGTPYSFDFSNCILDNVRAGVVALDAPSTYLWAGLRCRNVVMHSSGALLFEGCQGGIYDRVSGTPTGSSLSLTASSDFAAWSVCDPGLTPVEGSMGVGPVGNGVALTGSAYGNNGGGVGLPEIGDSVTITAPVFHGVTDFQSTAPSWSYTQTGGTVTNSTTPPTGVTAEYRVAPNSAIPAWTTWITLDGTGLGAALGLLPGYDTDQGLLLEVRWAATIADPLRVIRRVWWRTYVTDWGAPDVTVTLRGPISSDQTELRRLSDDGLIATLSGAGDLEFYAGADMGQSVYWVRKNTLGVEIMRTQVNPFTLARGDNGTHDLYAGAEVQVADSALLASLDALLASRLDVAVSTRAEAQPHLEGD